jgi:hypothetical protein
MTFPADGPTTAAAIRELAKIGDGIDVVRVERIAAAVNGFVLLQPSATIADGAADWSGVEVAHLVEGATMLGARLYRRKNTPDGVASLGGGEGAVYVRRSDPDVAMLLGLGEHAPPAVG